MDKTAISKEEALDYLLHDFNRDLRTWFRFEGQWKGCDFIPHMDAHSNPDRPYDHMIERDAHRSHIFAAAFQAMVEFTQTIWKAKGEDAAVQFCKERGLPICSAGLGGPLLSVDIMLHEAELVPENPKNEPFYDEAVALFKEVMGCLP